MLSLAAVTVLILGAAFAIQTAGRVGIAKTLRFDSPKHTRAPHVPATLAAYFAEVEQEAADLDLHVAGVFYVDGGDGRATAALYASDTEGRVWARFEPTGTAQLPTRLSLLSLLADGTVRATVFPHPDPLLPEPPTLRSTAIDPQSPKQALDAHLARIADEDVQTTDLRGLLARLDELQAQALAHWRQQGWLDARGRLTFAGVLKAGHRLERYADSAAIEVDTTDPPAPRHAERSEEE